MSEYGTGYAYCLGLFIAHEKGVDEWIAAKAKTGDENNLYPGMWFNGAADHLYELRIPTILPDDRRAEIESWRDQMIANRMDFGNKVSFGDVFKAIEYAKALLLEWDKVCGVECEKGEYE